MTFDEARAQFPVLDRIAYLNAGSIGPLARATVEAFVGQAGRDLADGRGGTAYIERMLELRGRARDAFAALLGVEATHVALVESTTRGCATVLTGLDLTGADEVVTTAHEHFGLLGPLYATGARVVVAEPTEDSVLAAITPRTRLLALSHILWTIGRRLDVRRLRRESGLPVLVDGAQAAGAIPVDVDGLDYYTVSAQKWLCAPDPAGALYVRDPESITVRAPSHFSQDSYEPTGAFVPKEHAARFDGGWIGLPALAGTVAALGVHPDWRYERAAETAGRCAALLAEHGDVLTPAGHSTLVSFTPRGDPSELVARLHERGVVVRELPGRNIVRASCGWWTSDDDLERLVAGVRS